MKKQKNVQEQIQEIKNNIKLEAEFWRNNDLPEYVNEIFKQKNIDTKSSIIIDYDRFYPGMSSDFGILLTENNEFFRFEIDKNRDNVELINWENLTKEDKFIKENGIKGIGKSFGAIAIEVLNEVNSII